MTDFAETWIAILVGVFAVFSLRSIFENDNSKIVSKEGRRILLDEDEMDKVNSKILESEENNEYQEVFI